MQTLQSFLQMLQQKQMLITTNVQISTNLQLTEIANQLIAKQGPAMLCTNIVNEHNVNIPIPALINLFGTKQRIAMGLGIQTNEFTKLGEELAFLRNPTPPKNFKDALNYLPIIKKVLKMSPNVISGGAYSQQQVFMHDKVNLDDLPIQTCWPNEPAPLVTWGVVITKGPTKNTKTEESIDDYNMGIYRMQKLGKNSLIMRWLAHRGGAQQFKRWQQANPNVDMPVCVAIGLPANVLLAGVLPLPENVSEYKFAGLLANKKVDLVKAKTNDLLVPANAEIILEGVIKASQTAKEGPYGDHTGYYNEVDEFPVFKVNAITMAKKPVYLTTHTGRPMDEPAVLGEALNDVLVPLLKAQFPEIVDFYLHPHGCSYRIAFVSINKSYAGHAKRIMFGVWSFLRQFMYTKFVYVFNHNINIRDINDVLWALSTNVDPARDTVLIENTPIDYLDFASPYSGLGSKMGVDATAKIPPETNREWGRELHMDAKTKQDVEDLLNQIFKQQ